MDSSKGPVSHLTLEERARLEQRLLSRRRPAETQSVVLSGVPQPLSFAQESLWFLDQLLPHSPLYNIPQAFRLRGRLERNALQAALDALVQRHHALRTQFTALDGSPLQKVCPKRFALEVVDLSTLPPSAREKEVTRLLDQEAKRPFSLGEDLMIRGSLLVLAEQEHVLMMTAHHIASDFASLQILHEELGVLYSAALTGRPSQLPALPIQFPDWVVRQRQRLECGAFKTSLAYWRDRLSGELPVLELPTDRPRTVSGRYCGARRPVCISVEVKKGLQQLCDREGVTRYMLLLAAFQTLLYRYSGQEDVLVGSPMANRADPGVQRMVGFLVNTVVLRTRLSGESTFRELLQRVRETAISAFAHQEVPFEKLVEELHVPRQPGSNPLCQVIFQYLASSWPAPRLAGISIEPLPMDTGTAKFELTLSLMESENGLVGDLEYNTDLFDATTVDRMLTNFAVLLESIVANPGERVGRLPLLSSAERQLVLCEWNQTASRYLRDSTIHEVFQEQVRRNPDAVAVQTQEQALTYAELNKQANQLAWFLLRRGVTPRSSVGICLERSQEMLVTLLAILKSGAAYVPMDPKYPEERLSYILQDSGVIVLVTNTEVQHSWPGRQLILLDAAREAIARESDEDLEVPVSAEDLAYVMYTSGSTGQPKGVAIPHRAVLRLVQDVNYAKLDSQEVFLQFAPLSFDASTFEIWGAFLHGARLVVYPPEFQSLEQFVEIIQRFQVTTLWLTAGLFHQLVEQHLDGLFPIRQLLAGGDVLSVPHVMQVLQRLSGCQLINGYGPTESTTFTCCYRFPRNWPGITSAPIGRPISATKVYLLDPCLAPVPIGVAGELCIAGDGLARCYINSPELTAQKFIPNPFSTEPGARLYRSGDQARYLADGNIEFLGRVDDQVKINGFRIHLSEVEAALHDLAEIRQAAVLASPGASGSKELAAYVVPTGDVSPAEIRRALGEKVPSHMIPSRIVLLNQLPLNANGKVDRHALPGLGGTPQPASDQPEPAHTPAEKRLLQIWMDVLGLERAGLDDNFFDSGGHSLLAMRLISRLNSDFQTNLVLGALFASPTPRALAEKMFEAARQPGPGPIKRRARAPLSKL